MRDQIAKSRTVIVVGAGASAEYGLPTGRELKLKIAELLDFDHRIGDQKPRGDELIHEAFCVHMNHLFVDLRLDPYLIAAARIHNAMPQAISIDNFIDCHRGDRKLELCGKLAIVQSILKAERSCSLFIKPGVRDTRLNFEAVMDTWMTSFMQLLTENCSLEELPDRLSKLTFVIFNYDRCVEHYIFHSLQNYYGVTDCDAAKLLQNLAIFHPYGSVGALPWQVGSGAMEFGGGASSSQLLAQTNAIKTFAEGTDQSSSSVVSIRNAVLEASKILFLGFAFHRLNLRVLKPGTPHLEPSRVQYFGTAMGMSKSDVDLVENDLTELASVAREGVCLRNDLTCAKYFSEHWRSLAF